MKNVGRKLLSIGLMLTMMFCCVSNMPNYSAVGIEENFDNNELLEKLAYAEKEAKEANERLQNCLRYPDCRNQIKCLEGDQGACNSIKSDKDLLYAKGALGVIVWNTLNKVAGFVTGKVATCTWEIAKALGRQAVRVFIRR